MMDENLIYLKSKNTFSQELLAGEIESAWNKMQ